MAAIQSGSKPPTVLPEMKVCPYYKPSKHAGFTPSSPIGQYRVVRNSETGAFEPYNGSQDRPEFPKIIFGEPGRKQLQKGTQTVGEYLPYYEKKQEYFARWICDYFKMNLERDSSYTLPNIICFGSRLADALITPFKYEGEWDFHAARFLNSVFLWADPQFFQSHLTTELGYGFAFEALMTGFDPASQPMDLMGNKPLAVHEKTLGKFSLLLVSDIDGEDEEGNWVELKIFEEGFVNKINQTSYPTDKFLNCWSQCVVSNSQRVIIGQHNKEGYLTNNLRTCTLPEFEQMIHMTQKHLYSCYDFLERLMNFVSEQFKQDDPNCAKQFLWKSDQDNKTTGISSKRKTLDKNNQTVKCVQAPEHEIPEWFIEMCTILKRILSNDCA